MLKLENVTKSYEKFSLEDISFNLPTGYVMGLIGDNGAGKTTLIKLIMNLIRRDAGKIEIFGLDNIADEVKIKDKIGFVYNENCFYGSLSLKSTAKIISRLYTNWDNELYNSLIEKFELDESKKISKLSSGMVMRFSIALALSHNAKLLIMDEPTTGLDPSARRDFLELLYEQIQTGDTSILFSSHITTDLDKIADYITMLKDGKLMFSESSEVVKDRYRIVKTYPNILNDSLKRSFSGYKETEVGFEGLCKTELLREVGSESAIISAPSIEEIMYYYERGGTR